MQRVEGEALERADVNGEAAVVLTQSRHHPISAQLQA